MMKKRLGINIFVVLVATIYAVVLVLGNVGVAKVGLAVEDGSYAQKFATDNNLNVVELSDSEKVYFDQRYELFDYNIEDNYVVLEEYNGYSTELVIPSFLQDRKVVGLSDNFMQSLKTVKNLYIPDGLAHVDGNVVENIVIYCSDDNEFYKDNMDSEWNFETVYDSDFVNHNLGELEYSYNVNGNTIEITHYNGEESNLLVIPSYINGMPVTEVSMNLLGTAKAFVIPSTVNHISGTVSMVLYTPVFAVELVFTVLTFLISLIVINILLPRYQKGDMEEYMLTGNQMIAVALYVVIQTGFSIYCIYVGKSQLFIDLVISLVILIGFIAALMMTGFGRNHVKEVEQHFQDKTSRMKSIKLSVKGMSELVNDTELKKQVQRLEDEIRYSDPVTREDLVGIETEIEDKISKLKKCITSGDANEIKLLTEELMIIVKERNNRCKEGK